MFVFPPPIPIYLDFVALVSALRSHEACPKSPCQLGTPPFPLFPQLLHIAGVAGLSPPHLQSAREWGNRAAERPANLAGPGAGQLKSRGKGLHFRFSGSQGGATWAGETLEGRWIWEQDDC